MNEEKPYSEKIKGYSTADLQVIASDIDREEYPERHKQVMSELAGRKQSGDHARSTHVPTHVARSIWWAFFWRSTLFTILAAFLLGIPLSLFKNLMQLSDASWGIVKTITVWAICIVIGIRVMSYILAKSYSTFTISITEKEPNQSVEPTCQPPAELPES